MKHTLTETQTLIGILKFRIERDEQRIEELDKFQRESMRIYKDCGTLNHQRQIEDSIKESGTLILSHKKDLKKWKKMLLEQENHLKFLTK